MSSSSIPVAYNIACEAPCDFGCVMRDENLLSTGSSAAALTKHA
jgi:hypothetical protein